MRKSTYGDGDDRAWRQQIREENRMLKQELSEQRHTIQKLQTDLKILSAAVIHITEKTNHLMHEQEMRVADAQLMLYTVVDKYMPNNEDILMKPKTH